MGISFNHTIVASRDKLQSAQFLAELFGLLRGLRLSAGDFTDS